MNYKQRMIYYIGNAIYNGLLAYPQYLAGFRLFGYFHAFGCLISIGMIYLERQSR